MMMSSDLPDAVWEKSPFSASGNCVERAVVAGGVAVRDSKDPQGPVLMFTTAEWHAFTRGVHAGAI
jgi:hypothetical protein